MSAATRQRAIGWTAVAIGLPALVGAGVGLSTAHAHGGNEALCCGAPVIALVTIPFGIWMLRAGRPERTRADERAARPVRDPSSPERVDG